MGFFSRSTPEERREKAEKKVAKKMSTNQPLVRTDIGPLRDIRDAIKMYAGFGGLNENKIVSYLHPTSVNAKPCKDIRKDIPDTVPLLVIEKICMCVEAYLVAYLFLLRYNKIISAKEYGLAKGKLFCIDDYCPELNDISDINKLGKRIYADAFRKRQQIRRENKKREELANPHLKKLRLEGEKRWQKIEEDANPYIKMYRLEREEKERKRARKEESKKKGRG